MLHQCYKSVVNQFTINCSMAKYLLLATQSGHTIWPLISSKTSNETIHQTNTGSHNTRLILSRTDKEVNRSGLNEWETVQPLG